MYSVLTEKKIELIKSLIFETIMRFFIVKSKYRFENIFPLSQGIF